MSSPFTHGAPGVAIVLATVLGLLVGSFLNVVIWRVPRGESIVRPPSACPSCGHAIRSRDNVPVLGWLVLRGRCRDCRAPISARYPLVEAFTGVAFGFLTWFVGVSWAWPAFVYLAAISIVLTFTDLDVHKLPNRIVLPSYVVLPALLALASWNPTGTADWDSSVRALIGGAALYVFYFALMLLPNKGMGFGDVKLAGLTGAATAWVAWGAFAVGVFAAFVLAGVLVVALLVTRRASRKSGIPFGPWILAGAWVGIVVGPALWDAYLGLV